MPTYDYRCDANGRVLEVNHRMSESLSTWGELCRHLGIEPAGTPIDAPVHRLATGVTSSPAPISAAAPPLPPPAAPGSAARPACAASIEAISSKRQVGPGVSFKIAGFRRV